MDAIALSGAPNASVSVQGNVQLPTQAQVDAGTLVGGTGASLAVTPDLIRAKLVNSYVADTGAANAYVITPSPAITAYATGQRFTFKATNASTTTSTLNVNGLGVKTIKKNVSADLSAGDIAVSQIIEVVYDGTNFQLISYVGTSSSNVQDFQASGTWTKPSGFNWAFIELWGAGGSGAASADSANGCDASGGAGGEYRSFLLPTPVLPSTVTVTVGTGGAAKVAVIEQITNGSAGGNTTFGSYATANGGAGGVARKDSPAGANANTTGGTAGTDTFLTLKNDAGVIGVIDSIASVDEIKKANHVESKHTQLWHLIWSWRDAQTPEEMANFSNYIESHIEDLLTTHNASILKALEERIEALKTDERKVAIFGEWQAESYVEKQLTNAVIETALTIAKELLEPKN